MTSNVASPLVITGMHRSGTSLVASLVQRAGIDIGRRLLGPARGNRHGHFEDVDVFEVHDEMLKARDLDILVDDVARVSSPSQEEEARANALIGERSGHWGFKDPRTTLFLDMWSRQLPAARYLFVYRHPLAVTLSILRRGTDVEALLDPAVCLRSWQTYNNAIVSFVSRRPDVCYLGEISAIAADPQSFVEGTFAKLGLPRHDEGVADLLRRNELSTTYFSDTVDGIYQALAPETVALYDRLEELADLPAVPTAGHAPVEQATLEVLQRLIKDPRASSHNALLPLLLTALEPETMAAIPDRLRRTFSELQEGIAWLQSQCDELRRQES